MDNASTNSEHQKAAKPIRQLYKILGFVIGKKISERVSRGHGPGSGEKIIELINSLRHEARESRDFKKIESIFKNYQEEYSDTESLKLLTWVQEAFGLLNQSSTHVAEVFNPINEQSNRDWARKLIENLISKELNYEELKSLFENDLSANLVLTAHPTAGISSDFGMHIREKVKVFRELAEKTGRDPNLDINKFLKDNELYLEIEARLNRIVFDLVQAKVYNEKQISPYDESQRFLKNIEHLWDLAPELFLLLEEELEKEFPDREAIKLNSNIFKIHTWVARDIDGNPTVNPEQHILSLKGERKFFLERYKGDVELLYEKLSADFSHRGVQKAFIVNEDFNKYFFDLCKKHNIDPKDPENSNYYRVVINCEILEPLKKAIDNLNNFEASYFSIEENLLKPLKLIRKNKEENLLDVDILIKKAEIFGLNGARGHTRKTKDVLNNLAKSIQDTSTDFSKESLDTNMLQAYEMLEVSHLGGIERQIISMSNDHLDLLNVISILKKLGTYPEMEIVPLIEQISDLRSSHEYTINALLDPSWREYLKAHNGRFVKMRGPSDSGKQNGFIASQWEMFKSKYFDAIVVDIFNAYRSAALGNKDPLNYWSSLRLDDLNKLESGLIKNTLEKFSTIDPLSLVQIPKIKLISFDGWGEPVERGSGLDFKGTVEDTQPLGSHPDYERTLQGGGAYGLYFKERTSLVLRDFFTGLANTGARKIKSDKAEHKDRFLKKDFHAVMERLVEILRGSLRKDAFGFEIDSDGVANEENLRAYFRHVIKSPLVFLDLFNIASRPTSRSGAKIAAMLPEYGNDLDKFASELPIDQVIKVLDDVRAIPYAAMFSLLGGNHVSFYGFSEVLKDEKLCNSIKDLYDSDESQESRLIRHMIDSLEKAVIMSDFDCYKAAHSSIEKVSDKSYDPDKDTFIGKIGKENKATMNFIARIKGYKVIDPQGVRVEELLAEEPQEKALILARRNDAAITRFGLGLTITKILQKCKDAATNPLLEENIGEDLLALLRTNLTSCTSNFGTGCLDA